MERAVGSGRGVGGGGRVRDRAAAGGETGGRNRGTRSGCGGGRPRSVCLCGIAGAKRVFCRCGAFFRRLPPRPAGGCAGARRLGEDSAVGRARGFFHRAGACAGGVRVGGAAARLRRHGGIRRTRSAARGGGVDRPRGPAAVCALPAVSTGAAALSGRPVVVAGARGPAHRHPRARRGVAARRACGPSDRRAPARASGALHLPARWRGTARRGGGVFVSTPALPLHPRGGHDGVARAGAVGGQSGADREPAAPRARPG